MEQSELGKKFVEFGLRDGRGKEASGRGRPGGRGETAEIKDKI